MLSVLELSHIIELAFLPLSCKCRIEPQGSLQAQIYDPITGRVELLATGISISSLSGSHAIAKLVNEIREELKVTHETRTWPRAKTIPAKY